MKKLLILSSCTVLLFTWISAVAEVAPDISSAKIGTASTPMTLFFLGVCLSVISFLGKKPTSEE